MATLTFSPHLSPRVIEVDSPTTSISVQELVDLIRAWEDTHLGLDFPYLIDAAGKEALGGGVMVGITATLQNAVIAFAMQGGVDSSGTVTTPDTTGKVLIDVAATFIADGILAGDTVLNVTDQSITSILSVDSETQVTTFGLQSGTDNQFGSSDSYKIWNKVQCEVAGGNLVAVDEAGAVMSPFLPTAQTHVLRSSSSSATLQELDAIQYGAFDDHVTVDTGNVTGRAVAGTIYPTGTESAPSDNLADALTIAVARGFDEINIKGNLVIGATDDISNYTLIGQGATLNTTKTLITLTSGCTTTNTVYKDCKVTGVQGGESHYINCVIGELSGAHCHYRETALVGPITYAASVGSTHTTDMHECFSGNNEVTLDQNSSQLKFVIYDFSGQIKFTNGTHAGSITRIHMNGGTVTLDATCTASTYRITGWCSVVNSSTATVDTTGLIKNAVWDEALAGHTTTGTAGKALSDAGAAGNPWGSLITGNTAAGTFGELVGKKLLTIAKFLGLK